MLKRQEKCENNSEGARRCIRGTVQYSKRENLEENITRAHKSEILNFEELGKHEKTIVMVLGGVTAVQ